MMGRSRAAANPDPSIARSVGQRLRAARVAAGLTGREVLEQAGIDPGNLSRMERSKRTPTVEVLGRLAALYGVSLADLLGPEPAGGASWVPRLSPNLAVDAFLASSDPQEAYDVRQAWSAGPDLRRTARSFAVTVFEPVRAALGVSLAVTSGLRVREPGLRPTAAQPCTHPHGAGLSADVVPVGMCLTVATAILAEAVSKGGLTGLDMASIEGEAVLHLQAAEEGTEPRRQVLGGGDLCSWGQRAVASRYLLP
jgi:transcriptional regulator with XRE-family HTH domain